jgi:hypothetical protein
LAPSGAAGGSENSASPPAGEQSASTGKFDLGSLELKPELAEVYAVQSDAVQWILETSTDIDIITGAAASMVPDIKWPAAVDVTGVLGRLQSHFYACLDPIQQILPIAQARAVACLKAMCHFYVERNMSRPFMLHENDFFVFYHGGFYKMLQNKDIFDIFCAAQYLHPSIFFNYHTYLPLSGHIASLSLSDRMWMARMFTYRLKEDKYEPDLVSFVIVFINICLDTQSPARLVADCLLLAGMLTGLQLDRRHLARLDKRYANFGIH